MKEYLFRELICEKSLNFVDDDASSNKARDDDKHRDISVSALGWVLHKCIWAPRALARRRRGVKGESDMGVC